MYDLHYWTTPNGHKITIFLEEAGALYDLKVVDINKGEQFQKGFLAIAPNNRIPALVDRSPSDGGPPVVLFESGAILLYLAEKLNAFLPVALRPRMEVLKWLFWQVGGLGPMLGQNHHFRHYAAQSLPYAVERYTTETSRLYGVLDHRLEQAAYLGGDDYSIADMATYPWIVPYQQQGQDLEKYKNIRRWFDAVATRPAVVKAYRLAKEVHNGPSVMAHGRSALFPNEPGLEA